MTTTWISTSTGPFHRCMSRRTCWCWQPISRIGGLTLPVEVSAVDSFTDAIGAPERRLQVTGKTQVSLVDVLMGREQLCDVLDLSREVSEYLVDRVGEWLGLPES